MSAAAPAAPLRRPAPASRPQRRSGPGGTGPVAAAVTAAAAAAVLLGAATQAAQGALPTAWGPLAHSVTAWVLLPAALTTAVLAALPRLAAPGGPSPRPTLVAAVATTQGLVAGYHGWAALVGGPAPTWSTVVLHVAAGLVSAVVVAGLVHVRAVERGPLRGAATGLLAAVPLVDGARAELLFPWQPAAGWGCAALAVVLLVVLPRRGERTASWTAAVAAVAAAALVVAALGAAWGLVSA